MPSLPAHSTTASSTYTAPTSQSPATNLPPEILSIISPRAYLLAHLQLDPPTRPSGRSPSTFRQTALTTSSLAHCLGSAVVRQGDTAVICGIQPEILLAKDVADPPRYMQRRRKAWLGRRERDGDVGSRDQVIEAAEALESLNLLVPNIDLSTGCSPSNLPGQPPSNAAQALSHRLYRLLLSSRLVDLRDLEIWRRTSDPDGADDENENDEGGATGEQEEVVAYYALHINLTVLSLSGARSLFSTAWLALLGALRDLRLPAARWDEDREMVLCDDDAKIAYGLELGGAPLVCCLGVFDGVGQGQSVDAEQRRSKTWVLADPNGFEDGLCEEWVDVVLDCSGRGTRILGIEKSGGGFVGRKELRQLVGLAEERWREMYKVLPSSRA